MDIKNIETRGNIMEDYIFKTSFKMTYEEYKKMYGLKDDGSGGYNIVFDRLEKKKETEE